MKNPLKKGGGIYSRGVLKRRGAFNRSITVFNDFFVTVGSNLASKIPKGKKTFKTFLGESVVKSFFINPTDSEMKKLINNLNQNKGLGPCSISVKIL